MPDNSVNLANLQAALQQAGNPWVAGTTSMTQLSDAERAVRLGATPPPGVASVDEIVQREPPAAGAAASVGAPAAHDWRNVGGKNFVTSVKDQGGCGSCVAFGTIGTIEITWRVQRNTPDFAVDLSEASLYYCNGQVDQVNCSTGWWPDNALKTCENPGVTDEACFVYTAGNQACSRCADWQNRLVKVTAHHALTGQPAAMKEWLATRGALDACFVVYDDFFAYKSGVYKHVSGNKAGGHCVVVVGYDDAQGCWICRNSWGTGWGDGGFFKIAYGEKDTAFESWGIFAVDGILETMWLNNKTIVGLWTIDQDRNAWVYVSDIGWRRIAFDNDNIFFDLLAQLSTAKAGHRPVNLFEDQGIITQVYVL
jgi:C1A family cysteine protease